ncbi:MAG: large extracellular alpha-helical protein, partial [Gammaproteobacteria bacterium]|nr:large extracellular alpha-helical protein [Gammaproteobacteria bacterium]
GWYDFRLSSNFTGMSWSPLKVLVTDFTPAPFKVETEHLGKRFKAGDKVNIRASASMFAGGPYANAKIRLTSTLRSAGFHNTNQSFKKFHFGYFNASGTRTLLNRNATLNNEGEITESFVLPDSLNFYVGTIDTEAAVTDDRGKSVASMASTKFVGRDRFVGLRNTQWVYNAGEKATFEAVVLDDESQIVTNVPIHVKVKYQETVISRVKGPGNAYLSRYTHNWIDVHECKISSEKGAVRCTFVPEKPGSYQFQASVNDSKGRSHQSTITAWVTGSGFVNWAQENNDNLEIIAEETSLTIGQTANYLVKNPFPGAMALVTIERYGVLKSWVQELKTGTPLISFEVLPDYLPGFYLSVTVMSPRVDKPLENGKVDLGKPTYRMGYVSSSVVDPYKTLDVKVKTDSETYQPRSQVKASIEVSSKEARNKRFEIAVAVVDESVLALNKERKSYYDPYAGFNHLDNLDLKNYSLISQLLGRQRFEKKGVDSGGDGDPGVAPSALRNLFKYVTYWNPSIVPDSDGKANIDFVVPDNLTGWRVLAWAVTPDDFMGLGDSNFKVSKHTEIRPVMPNQLVEGDSFKAGFSVMNRTDKTRTIQTFLQVVGPLEKGTNTTQNKVITLKPFEKQIVWMPLKTRGDGVLRFMAGAGDNSSSDRMEHQLVVNKRRSLETAATYGTTEKEKVSESVHIPENIYTDVGEVSVTLSPTVIGNIDGAFEYVKDYPYFCWEQRLTKAVMASNNKILSDYLKKETRWENPDAMVQDHLDRAASYQAPNGGMAFWIGRNDYVSPYLSAYTAIAFNWLRQAGYRIPETVESRLHEYLQTMIRKDVFPDFYSKGMASSVRAVALAALAEHNKAMGQDTKRYMEHLQEMDLFGRSFLLSAAIRTNLNKDAIDSVLNSILGSANQTGGKFQFLEMLDDSYKTMLATPLRSNCTILSSLVEAQKSTELGNKIADIPFKLVRMITQARGNRNHWENTQENVFCLNSLVDYSGFYEPKAPMYSVDVTFDNQRMGSKQFSSKQDALETLSRPIQDGDAGKRAQIELHKKGEGRLYYSARVSYDLKEDNRSRINSGIEVRREYSVERNGEWTILQSPMKLKRGELVRVDLFVSVPATRHFVVVNDPLPGGLEPVNQDLATASTID